MSRCTGGAGRDDAPEQCFALLRYRFHTLWAPILAHGFDDTIGFTWLCLFRPVYGLW